MHICKMLVVHVQLSSGVRGLNFGLSLLQSPVFVCLSS